MKKKILLILALILLFQSPLTLFTKDNISESIVFALEEKDPEEVVEEELTEEEKEKLRQEEIKRLWEEAVNKHIHKSIDQLTTAYLIGDFTSGEILEGENIDELVAIASTSKIITIYVVMDEIKKGNISLDDKITVDRQTSFIRGSSYDLKEDEVVTVEELIKAAMIVSGNDAVVALAKHVAGSQENFVNYMKNKLEELGIKKYEMINASGLPNYNIDKQNMMTTRDLFYLSRAFIKDYPEILEITKLKELKVPEREFEQKNTNPILGEIPEIDGLKTGYTGLAGRCMVATGLKKGNGKELLDTRLITITMGSNSDAERYVAIKKLTEKAFDEYQYQTISDTKLPMGKIYPVDLSPSEVNVYPKEEMTLLVKKNDTITYNMNYRDINVPTEAGTTVGDIKYYYNGELIHQTDLIIKEDIVDASFLARLQKLYRDFFMSAYHMFNG